VLDLPPDPALYTQALLDCPWIEAITLTHEDFVRVEGYRARGQIIRSRESAANLEDFLASLGMKVYLQPLDQGNTARAAQLSAKTNQFNATTRRYNQRQLEELASSGADVVVIGLEDKYTQFENIGLMILRPDDRDRRWLAIDTYLLSCRVLGRGLESALVRWVVGMASRRGHIGVVGEIVETERNAPVRSVYSDVGFEADGRPGLWRLAVADGDRTEPLCSWLTIVDCISSDYSR
jgi:FkbH-like protein